MSEPKDIPKATEGLTDAELQAELQRREAEREKLRQAAHDDWQKKFVAVLTLDVIDGLAPGHERSSCSDANISNGFHTRDAGGFRCARCALLEAMNDKYIPYPVRFKVFS